MVNQISRVQQGLLLDLNLRQKYTLCLGEGSWEKIWLCKEPSSVTLLLLAVCLVCLKEHAWLTPYSQDQGGTRWAQAQRREQCGKSIQSATGLAKMAARARAFKEWESLVFSDFPQGIWELFRFGKVFFFFGSSPAVGYDSSQRMAGLAVYSP